MKTPSIASVLTLAAVAMGGVSDSSLAEIVRSAPRPVEGTVVKCALCGRGGGTLVNNGTKARKIHRPSCKWEDK